MFGVNYFTYINEMHLAIMRNNETILPSAVGSEGYFNDYAHGSVQDIIECDVGQTVWIRATNDLDFMASDDITKSAFFGYIL